MNGDRLRDPEVPHEARQPMEEEVMIDPLLAYFAFDHLPEHLQRVSASFCDLAVLIVRNIPRNPERTVALRKLLEAKDCAVRAALPV